MDPTFAFSKFSISFSVNLYELKTYHEVIDEIYYKVQHLEPWEKGSRKTAGQTGMCGGVSVFYLFYYVHGCLVLVVLGWITQVFENEELKKLNKKFAFVQG